MMMEPNKSASEFDKKAREESIIKELSKKIDANRKGRTDTGVCGAIAWSTKDENAPIFKR
jgi:hypothetical protein